MSGHYAFAQFTIKARGTSVLTENKLHRFAMLGAAGMIAPEILGRAGLIPQETAVVWFKSVSNLTPEDKWAKLERSRGLSCLPRSSNLRPVRAPLDSYLVSAQSIGQYVHLISVSPPVAPSEVSIFFLCPGSLPPCWRLQLLG